MVAGRIPGLTKNGKPRYQFLGKATSWRGPAPKDGTTILLPDRQCIGCRLEYSRQWATRLLHETAFHRNACFLTLTYSDDKIPKNGSLYRPHLTTFFKDLRSRLEYHGKGKIKYFAVGEYGDQTQRPHYHVALYGPIGCHGSDDQRTEESLSRSGARQFTHADLSACWEHGLHRFSELSFESAAYVARYVLKKVTGISKAAHYGDRAPEFSAPSKGLGKQHVETWQRDIYPSDHVVLPGRGDFLPPPYYDRLLEKADPGLFQKVKKARQEAQEKMNASEWFEHIERRNREGEVRKHVTEETLIRGGI